MVNTLTVFLERVFYCNLTADFFLDLKNFADFFETLERFVMLYKEDVREGPSLKAYWTPLAFWEPISHGQQKLIFNKVLVNCDRLEYVQKRTLAGI